MGHRRPQAPESAADRTMRRARQPQKCALRQAERLKVLQGSLQSFHLGRPGIRGTARHALYVNRCVSCDSGVTMDAIELLVGQHRELEARFAAALAAGAEEKQRRFGDIADHLAMHIVIEERLFYPAVKEKWTEYDLLLSLEEHLSLKRLVADLVGLGGADQTYHPKLKILYAQAAHHHREEENNLFVKVSDLLTPAERARLSEQKQALLSSQHRERRTKTTAARLRRYPPRCTRPCPWCRRSRRADRHRDRRRGDRDGPDRRHASRLCDARTAPAFYRRPRVARACRCCARHRRSGADRHSEIFRRRCGA